MLVWMWLRRLHVSFLVFVKICQFVIEVNDYSSVIVYSILLLLFLGSSCLLAVHLRSRVTWIRRRRHPYPRSVV